MKSFKLILKVLFLSCVISFSQTQAHTLHAWLSLNATRTYAKTILTQFAQSHYGKPMTRLAAQAWPIFSNKWATGMALAAITFWSIKKIYNKLTPKQVIANQVIIRMSETPTPLNRINTLQPVTAPAPLPTAPPSSSSEPLRSTTALNLLPTSNSHSSSASSSSSSSSSLSSSSATPTNSHQSAPQILSPLESFKDALQKAWTILHPEQTFENFTANTIQKYAKRPNILDGTGMGLIMLTNGLAFSQNYIEYFEWFVLFINLSARLDANINENFSLLVQTASLITQQQFFNNNPTFNEIKQKLELFLQNLKQIRTNRITSLIAQAQMLIQENSLTPANYVQALALLQQARNSTEVLINPPTVPDDVIVTEAIKNKLTIKAQELIDTLVAHASTKDRGRIQIQELQNFFVHSWQTFVQPWEVQHLELIKSAVASTLPSLWILIENHFYFSDIQTTTVTIEKQQAETILTQIWGQKIELQTQDIVAKMKQESEDAELALNNN